MDKAKIKAQFDKARVLIEQKRYDDARAVLTRIDHPKAADWLVMLDEKEAKQGGKKMRDRVIASLLVLFVLILCLFIYAGVKSDEAKIKDIGEDLDRQIETCATMRALDVPCEVE